MPHTVQRATSVALAAPLIGRIICSSTRYISPFSSGIQRLTLSPLILNRVLGKELARGAHKPSNFSISQEPLTFASVTLTLLDVTIGSGFSLLAVFCLTNTSTTAEFGF